MSHEKAALAPYANVRGVRSRTCRKLWLAIMRASWALSSSGWAWLLLIPCTSWGMQSATNCGEKQRMAQIQDQLSAICSESTAHLLHHRRQTTAWLHVSTTSQGAIGMYMCAWVLCACVSAYLAAVH